MVGVWWVAHVGESVDDDRSYYSDYQLLCMTVNQRTKWFDDVPGWLTVPGWVMLSEAKHLVMHNHWSMDQPLLCWPWPRILWGESTIIGVHQRYWIVQMGYILCIMIVVDHHKPRSETKGFAHWWWLPGNEWWSTVARYYIATWWWMVINGSPSLDNGMHFSEHFQWTCKGIDSFELVYRHTKYNIGLNKDTSRKALTKRKLKNQRPTQERRLCHSQECQSQKGTINMCNSGLTACIKYATTGPWGRRLGSTWTQYLSALHIPWCDGSSWCAYNQ